MLPLTEIVPLEPALPEATSPRSSSPAPMRCATRRPGSSRRCSAKPVFAVGDETAAAAKAAGFADVRSSAGNAADLARDIAAGVAGEGADRLSVRAGPAGHAGGGACRGGLRCRAASKPTTRAERLPRAQTSSARSMPARSPRRSSIRRRAPRVSQGWYRRGRERSFAHRVHLHLAARRQGTCASSRAEVCLRPKRRMKTPCSNFLSRPGHDPAPFPINLA